MRLLRPAHWIKNLFVAAPALFSGTIADKNVLVATALSFVAFCLASASVYCINDIHDMAADRRHPVKRFRPIASGDVSPTAAAFVAATLFAIASALSFIFLGAGMLFVIIGYLILNILYTNWLKRIPIIDISIIACGFILRLIAGSLACREPLSGWIVTTTFLLTLFLALGKRHEDISAGGTAPYSIRFINLTMALVGAATIGVYSAYALSPATTRHITSEYLYLTCFPVAIGIMRYLQISIQENRGADHIRILTRDPVIALSSIGYLAIFLTLWIMEPV